MNAKKQTTAKARPSDVTSHDWMAPISTSAPCGPDLEYDPEYVVMSAKSTAQPDAQYGNFVGSAEPVNWGDIDRDCRRLMLRTKDIRIAVLFIRCRTRLAGAVGFSEGMRLLASLLETYPDNIHPQLAVDADRDAALEIRANTLQALTDTEGLLSDLREVSFGKGSVARLQVRDVERAFARPRPADALSQDSVIRQLDALRQQHPAALEDFDQAMAGLSVIREWCAVHLGSFVPDLSALNNLLGLFARPYDTKGARVDAASRPVLQDGTDSVVLTLPTNMVDAATEGHAVIAVADETVATARNGWASSPNRQTALEHIRLARAWFEINEPSSPIPVLLKRAESFVGARYAQVVRAIPPDLLAQWEVEADNPP